MRKLAPFLIASLALSSAGHSQVGGGSAAYGQRQSGPEAAEANERTNRIVSKDDAPPGTNGMFLDASVLVNVKADGYVAVFSISQEGVDLAAARAAMDVAVSAFTGGLRKLGVKPSDTYVDFVAQNRVYGYEVVGDVAKEKVVGFEVKKNVSIHYRDERMLDQIIAEGSNAGIFDLIKVDYIVKDTAAVQSALMEDASRVIKRKAANYERLLGIHLGQSGQVWIERYSSYYPTDMYSSYIAQESESVAGSYRQNLTVQGARKPRTFYFDGLSAKTFDHVINPVVTEPVVQFTLYLKVRYDKLGAASGKSSKPGRTRR